MTFGEFLKSNRETRGWTQPQAAIEIDIEQSYLSKLENNKAIPSSDIFARLMAVYDFSMQQLSDQVQTKELNKLKELVAVKEFLLTTKVKSESTRRRWLKLGTLLIAVGVFVLTLGVVMKDHKEYSFTYESKGVIHQGEPATLFVSFPNYQMYNSLMQNTNRRIELEKRTLFPRLSHEQTTLIVNKGNFFDMQVESGYRRYNLLKVNEKRSLLAFYLGVAFGLTFITGGLCCFYLSRKW